MHVYIRQFYLSYYSGKKSREEGSGEGRRTNGTKIDRGNGSVFRNRGTTVTAALHGTRPIGVEYRLIDRSVQPIGGDRNADEARVNHAILPSLVPPHTTPPPPPTRRPYPSKSTRAPDLPSFEHATLSLSLSLALALAFPRPTVHLSLSSSLDAAIRFR